ncbi:MAG TPA: SRPBCC domain-containing protein [Rhizomicrobium sp.]|jgi:uncharacterized protein YndB with AHSA1/START domain|nr:SRPBCC domain-containing protein [Rhizomicrobium sp.]
MSASLDNRVVTIVRTFEAPRELVFRMWTEPTHFAAWWGPAHNRNSACSLDPRPGGQIRIQMTGQDYDNAMGGAFVEVDPPKRLVYIARGVPDEVGRWQVENHNTVTFEETDGVTTMTLHCVVTHIAPEIEEALDFMGQGMSESFDKMAAVLAAARG